MGRFLSRRWRRQPTNLVEVDERNVLARDLAFVAAPWVSMEVLSRTPATFSGVTVGPTADGLAFKSPNNTSGVWFDLPTSHPVYQRIDGASNFSFMFRGGITAYAAYGAFLSIDYAASHANPFNTLGFLSDGSTTAARFETSGAGANLFGGRASTTGYLDTSGNLATWIGAASSGGASAYQFFKSGSSYADNGAIDGNYTPQPLDNNLPVTLFAHSDSYLSSGSTGYCTLATFWARTLAAAEAAELHVNPWQLFRPRRNVLYFVGSAAQAFTRSVVARCRVRAAVTVSAARSTSVVARTARPRAIVTASAGRTTTITARVRCPRAATTVAATRTCTVVARAPRPRATLTVAATRTTSTATRLRARSTCSSGLGVSRSVVSRLRLRCGAVSVAATRTCTIATRVRSRTASTVAATRAAAIVSRARLRAQSTVQAARVVTVVARVKAARARVTIGTVVVPDVFLSEPRRRYHAARGPQRVGEEVAARAPGRIGDETLPDKG